MAEFERPRAKALTDAELAQALRMFPSDASGVEAAARLMADQQRLREQDALELQSWIELLRARDDEQSKKILAESLSKIFAPEPLEVQETRVEPAVFTSELPIITRKGRVAQRLQLGNLFRVIALAFVLGVTSASVLGALGITGMASLISAVAGIAIALIFSFPLKRHLLHPILRAAAVFGGRGVYIFGGLVLALLSLLYSSGFLAVSEFSNLASIGPYSAVLVLVVAGSTLMGQLFPVRHGYLIITLPAVVAAGLMSYGTFSFDLNIQLPANFHWGVIWVALASTVILTIGLPHTQLTTLSSLWVFPTSLVAVFALVAIDSEFDQLALPVLLGALSIALVYSGRDLAGAALGRFAGLALLIGLILSPFAQQLTNIGVSLLSATLMLMLLDQLARTSPLHVPSLDTSYGFYGSFSISGWLGLVLAAIAGSDIVLGLLPRGLSLLEWALLVGAAIGVVLGLLRIAIVRRQDREIKNIDSSSGNIENLLGL